MIPLVNRSVAKTGYITCDKLNCTAVWRQDLQLLCIKAHDPERDVWVEIDIELAEPLIEIYWEDGCDTDIGWAWRTTEHYNGSAQDMVPLLEGYEDGDSRLGELMQREDVELIDAWRETAPATFRGISDSVIAVHRPK